MNYRMGFFIIGQIMRVEGALMALPLAVSLYYQEGTWYAFLVPILLLLGIGTIFSGRKPRNSAVYAREGFVVVAVSWIVLSAFGALPFFISREIPVYIDCLFETVSGFTTTGSSILADVEALSQGMLFWRSFTHWIGGMGVLVFLLAILPQPETSSMYLLRAEVPGPIVGKLVSKSKLTARILYGIYCVLTLVEILLLVLGGMPLFDSVVHTFGTAGTGGFGIKNTSIAFYDSAYIDNVIGVFMMLFGVNFNIFYFILIGHGLQALKSEELRVYLGIILAAVALIAVDIFPLYGNFGQTLRYAFFQVSSIITTTGFATADFTQWPMFSQCILVLLMFVGACAGSTGGGLKIARVIMMVKSAFRELRRMLFPRAIVSVKLEGKPVDLSVVHGVSSFFLMYMLVMAVSVFLVTLDERDMVTTFTSVVSCMNNIGPGMAEVGPLGNFGAFSYFAKGVLTFDMLAGRLEIFPMMMLFVPRTWKVR